MRHLMICAAMVAPVLLGMPFTGVQGNTASAAAAGSQPDSAKVEALAKKIDAETKEGKFTLLEQTIDHPALVDRGLQGIDVPADFRQGMLRSSIGKQICNELARRSEAGASYRFLRVRQKDGQTRALFRLAGDDGLNYHDLVVEDGPRGLRIVDVYIMATGELISQTVRRMSLPALFQLSKKAPPNDPGEQDYIKSFDRVTEFGTLARTGKGKEALKVYDTLPAKLKKDPAMMVLRVMAAASSGDEDLHLKAIEDFQATHPDSPAVSLLSIDGFIIRQKWDQAFKAVDQLDKLLDGDPYLEIMRGNIAFAQGQADKARTFLDRAIQRDPTLADAYYTAIDLALAQKDFDRVASLLSAATRNAGVTWPDLSGHEPFAEFVKSPAYKRWRKESGQ